MSDSKPISVAIGAIDPGLRPAREMRAAMDQEAIAQYAEDIIQLPPVRLMRDDKRDTYWVVDGAHTITAATTLGDEQIRAVVAPGDYHQAFAEATRCNGAHGVRITSADKRARVAVALKDPVMRRWSDRKIAECCNVSHNLVSEIRAQMRNQLSSDDTPGPEKTVGRDGKARRRPSPRPAPMPPPPLADGNGDGDDMPPWDFGILNLSERGQTALPEMGWGSEVRFRCAARPELEYESDYTPGPYGTLEAGWKRRDGTWTTLAQIDLVVPMADDLLRQLGEAIAQAREIARAARRRSR
jgi:hypothetical protein